VPVPAPMPVLRVSDAPVAPAAPVSSDPAGAFGELAPAPGELAPTEGALAPPDGALAPTPGELAPTDGALAPTLGALAPTLGALTPTPGEPAPTPGEPTLVVPVAFVPETFGEEGIAPAAGWAALVLAGCTPVVPGLGTTMTAPLVPVDPAVPMAPLLVLPVPL